jgi:hypothetical protein
MRTLIVAAVAIAIAGAAAFKPAPAQAFIWVPFMLEAKKDPNFKAVNPYAPKAKKAKAKKK